LNQLERLWGALLSGQPEEIRSAFSGLDTETKKAVLNHLRHMTQEEGWLPQQKQSAQTALEVLHASELPDA